MRWVRHLTSAHTDDRHQQILDRCGLRGYGAYWLLLEIVAARVDSDNMETRASAMRGEWARRLRTSPVGAAYLMRQLADVGLIEIEDKGGLMSVSFPNLLKYHDDYTRKLQTKSGHTPDKVRTDAGHDAVREVKRSKEKRSEVGKSRPQHLGSIIHGDVESDVLGASSQAPAFDAPEPPDPCRGPINVTNASHQRILALAMIQDIPTDGITNIETLVQMVHNKIQLVASQQTRHGI